MLPLNRTLLPLAALWLIGCSTQPASTACQINGPANLLPKQVEAVRTGMTREQLEALMGSADYSPADGVLYFSTGGDCPLGDEGHQASCGLVAEFQRDYVEEDGSVLVLNSLQACRWGAIGE